MLDAVTVSEPAPGGANDDLLLVSGRWAVVLDGVSSYPVPDVGCQHTVPWFVSRLGLHLGYGLAVASTSTLPNLLATAIEQTAAEHGPACDLGHPLTPAATVAIVRLIGDQVEWLVLGDATVAWMLADGSASAITDDRADHLPDAPVIVADVRRYDPDFVARVRNQPGGFWVAAADAGAANQALTGTLRQQDVQRVGLMSDGITRLVERYDWSWADVFAHVDQRGARSLVDAVRKAESDDHDPSRWRGKPHDDATAVIARLAA
ncbi:protein phosphatase 2C domain-containing protein [Catellatospora citrea]|uniref:protein phosphatase 2C domain-containing protein n=1 Tax=Catellatospora citrea TaxID=53366 RepID=UPI000FF863A8|nr:protein phosphatase 2C domain-containing protein [Catellatospora citrea]RKE09691.1 protein phosphatase 2C-like protein [Catellatospora citrea]